MAKGNLFLGMGRGKVGDVVFYRMNGRQMSRVRNRDPKNPRSNEQLYQRAVIATVMKAYSIGKEIYDHSFQGYTVGEGCMRRFNSVNARILREQLAVDVNDNYGSNNVLGRFVWPKSTEAVPFPGMQVSEGTLTNNLIEIEQSQPYDGISYKFADTTATETAQAYFSRLGINPGDIFTFVFHMVDFTNKSFTFNVGSSVKQIGYSSKFFFVRLILKDNIPTTPISTATIDQLFILEQSSPLLKLETINQMFNAEGKGENLQFTGSYANGGVSACIRSRLDIDVRSTAYMRFYGDSDFGINSNWVLPVWQSEVQKIGTSELILEGGDLDVEIHPFSDDAAIEVQREKNQLANYPTTEAPRRTARHKGTTNTKE